MKIGIDLDGVCYNFTDSLKKYLVEHEGFPEYELGETTTWNFFKDDWGMSLEDYLMYFERGVDAGIVFLHGEPHLDCVDVLNRLREDGHTLHIVTWRQVGQRSVHNTSDWLLREKIPYDTLTFAKDKTILPVDIFIEDNMDNYTSLCESGVRAVLMDRPWNHDLTDAVRVQNWNEFYEFVGDMNV